MTAAGTKNAGNGESSSSTHVAMRDGNGSSHLNGSNNVSSSSANGHSNGHATITLQDEHEGFKPLHEGSYLDRTEFIRITLQSLKELGFESSAKSLETESGITLEHTSIVAFRKAVLSGDWRNSERLLIDGLKYGASRLAGTSRGTPASADVSSVLRDAHFGGLDSIKFLLHQQRYLELLETRQTRKALSVLRDRLAPLNHGSDRLHQLSSLVICATSEELRLRAKWDGTGPVSRRKLLQEIESAVSPLVMVPSRRLPHLIEQAQQWQKMLDPFYNLPPDAQLSLYIDHQSDRSVFPTQTAAILTGHSDEVWHVVFSHDGTRLASVGQDKEAIIWSVGPNQEDFEVLHRYGPHTGPICHAAWSDDDTMLLTTTLDGEVNVWNVSTGSKKEYREHVYTVGTASWLPDNEHFVTGGMDGKIVLWNIDGTKRHTWTTTPYRVQALAVSPDGKYLVALSIRTISTHGAASSNLHGQSGTAISTRAWTRSADEAVRTAAGASGNGSNSHFVDDEVDDLGGGSRVEGDEKQRIQFFDLEKREDVGSIYLWEELTSVIFSDDSRHILVNQRPNESQIWDVRRQCLVMRLNGHKVQKHVIRSCFGGVERAFIITGSEDSLIYVYHRKTGKLLEKLKGHGEGSVNSVAWHPTHHSMFASCSDDGTIRIWKPKAGGRSYADDLLRNPASSEASHATNGHDRDSSMTEPSPFPWSNSPRSPASPTALPSLGRIDDAALRSSAVVSSSLRPTPSQAIGQPEDDEEDDEDDDDDEEDDEEDDDDVMAE